MAVVSSAVSASVRFADDDKKTLCTFSGIKTDVTPGAVVMFGNGVEGLRDGKSIDYRYVTVAEQLTEV